MNLQNSYYFLATLTTLATSETGVGVGLVNKDNIINKNKRKPRKLSAEVDNNTNIVI
jgi:hypothetical protein